MIRTANIGDARRIAEIQVASWRASYRGIFPDDYLDGLNVGRKEKEWEGVCRSNDAVFLVMCPAMTVVGFCHITSSRDDDGERAGEITSIYLDPACWRKGFGRQLVSAARSFASVRGFEEITLWVLRGNLRGIAFYEAMGFHPDGAVKREQRPGFSIEQIRYRCEPANIQ